jgi:integrase
MNGSLHHLDSGRWRVRWRDATGSHSRTFDAKREASVWLAHVRRQTSLAELPLPDRRTLGEFLTEWWAQKRHTLRARSQREYERCLRLHIPAGLKGVQLRSVNPRDVEAVLAALTPDNARTCKAFLNQALQDAVRYELIERNPATAARVPKKEATQRITPDWVLSPSDVLRIAEAVPEHYKAMVLFAAYSGLRFGEIAGLRPDDISLEARTCRVERQWCDLTKRLVPPKTQAAYRTAVFSSRIVEAITLHLEQYATEGIAFPTETGRRLDNSNFNRRIWRPTVKAVGLEGRVFHDLRDVSASLLIRGGVNLAMVSRLLGHSNSTVTLQRYAGFFAEDLSKAQAVLDEL